MLWLLLHPYIFIYTTPVSKILFLVTSPRLQRRLIQ